MAAAAVTIPARVWRLRNPAPRSIRWAMAAGTDRVIEKTGPRSLRSAPVFASATVLLDVDQPDLIGQTISDDRIAVGRDVHVADDIAAARDRPTLKFLCRRVEPHDRVRLRSGFRIPHCALGKDDAVRF